MAPPKINPMQPQTIPEPAYKLTPDKVAGMQAETAARAAAPYQQTGKALMGVGALVALLPGPGTLIGGIMMGAGAVATGIGAGVQGDPLGGAASAAGGVNQGVNAATAPSSPAGATAEAAADPEIHAGPDGNDNGDNVFIA